MSRIQFLAVALIGLGNFLSPGQPSMGQGQDVNKQLFGAGVHAYFSGSMTEAYDLFSTAISNETDDPRVFYYRGMTLLNLGRRQAADADFAVGARMEAMAAGSIYPIDRSLERLQGVARLSIERHRTMAVAIVEREAAERQRQRYEQIENARPNVTTPVEPGESVFQPSGEVPPEVTPPTANPDNPLSKPVGEPPEVTPTEPAPPVGEPATGPNDPLNPGQPAGEPPEVKPAIPVGGEPPLDPNAGPPAGGKGKGIGGALGGIFQRAIGSFVPEVPPIPGLTDGPPQEPPVFDPDGQFALPPDVPNEPAPPQQP